MRLWADGACLWTMLGGNLAAACLEMTAFLFSLQPGYAEWSDECIRTSASFLLAAFLNLSSSLLYSLRISACRLHLIVHLPELGLRLDPAPDQSR